MQRKYGTLAGDERTFALPHRQRISIGRDTVLYLIGVATGRIFHSRVN